MDKAFKFLTILSVASTNKKSPFVYLQMLNKTLFKDGYFETVFK